MNTTKPLTPSERGKLGGRAKGCPGKPIGTDRAKALANARWNKHKGWKAIARKASDDSIVLCKYTDPIEGARENITLDEARAIAKEDPSLIYVKSTTTEGVNK